MGVFTIGLDFGTNSVRAVVVDTADGREIASSVFNYPSGVQGVFYDASDDNVARQHPRDYLEGIQQTVRAALAVAEKDLSFSPKDVVGIGVDTTGSSPLPISVDGTALALLPLFENELDAMVWLWKDHTAFQEADEITLSASQHHPEYLTKCGGRYSSEWFWAKLMKLARKNPAVAASTASWVELADWIPAVLSGTTAPQELRRGVCAAGHKAMYHPSWDGYPDPSWLDSLDPVLARVATTFPTIVYDVSSPAGHLSDEWAVLLGLNPGITIGIGAFDAHLGAIGAGIRENTLVKVIGTSTCDIMVARPKAEELDVPGLCGIVPGSVLPGYLGLEAGQSAVGDIYNWFVNQIGPGEASARGHEALTDEASQLVPGESGLLTLDWHNGNRTVLVDQRLTGLTVGMSLHTTQADLYRALLEASAFGARVIVERLEEFGVPVRAVVNCGGISARNPLAMQIYADVLNRPVTVSAGLQTCALGSAIAASVAAKVHPDFATAVNAMADKGGTTFQPSSHVPVYEKLFGIYRQLHDSFGIPGAQDLSAVMKDLLTLRDDAMRSRLSNAA